MGHDVNNGLSAIILRAGLAKSLIEENLECAAELQEVLDCLDAIVEASEIVGLQVDSLKKYVQGGRSFWQPIMDIYGQSVLPKDIKITAEEGLERIYLHMNPLAPAVLENLVNNTKLHGQKATTIHVSYEIPEEKELSIFCRDNGIGVPPEKKRLIFNKGFGDNTGLGLFYTRAILEIDGIQISEIGEYGEGANFEIIVPQDSYIMRHQ